jgi:hypothetical protein
MISHLLRTLSAGLLLLILSLATVGCGGGFSDSSANAGDLHDAIFSPQEYDSTNGQLTRAE